MDQDKFIKDWLEGKIDPDKLNDSGDGENHKKIVKELDGIVNKSNQLEVPSKKSKAQAWDEFMDKIDEQESDASPEKVVETKTAKTFSIKRYIPLGIAASLLVIAIAYLLTPGQETIQSVRGEQLSHILPDGSKVMLNADSEIFYSKANYSNDRTVSLKGEAFFEVEPGNSFVVKGEYGSVEVLGTSFNVYFREKEVKVSCFTGQVMVKRGNSEEKLTPGQITQSDKGESLTAPITFNTNKTASWRLGEFYYDQTPFSEVLQELERQYNIEVQYSPAEDEIYNGYFNNKDLDEALQLVFVTMSLEYRLEGDKVIVK